MVTKIKRKVFILEDDPERVRWFREQFPDADLTIIDSCKDADKFQPPYDIIFLDHDLGGRQMAGDRCVHCGSSSDSDASCRYCQEGTDHEDCGAMFVGLIKDRLDFTDTVIIHSYNADGAKNMLKQIDQGIPAFYLPFRGPAFNLAVTLRLKHWEKEEAKRAKH